MSVYFVFLVEPPVVANRRPTRNFDGPREKCVRYFRFYFINPYGGRAL